MADPDGYSPEAQRLRHLLSAAGLSIRGGARRLGLTRGRLREYTEGRVPIPQYIWLAAERLAETQELRDAERDSDR